MRNAVLITGGARRVGRAVALLFAEEGYDVALHYHTSREEAEQTAASIRAKDVSCELFAADLADAGALPALISAAQTAFPRLSVLVNNASVFDAGSFMEGDIALYQKQCRINTEAPIFLTQAFAKIVRRGAVVNMLDSMVAKHKHSYFYYLLSKKTLHAFTQMAAAELGPHIRVNGVCPGYVLPSGEWGEEYQTKLEAKLPLRKTATLAEVAQAVYGLATQPAITGQCLFLDGGEFLL